MVTQSVQYALKLSLTRNNAYCGPLVVQLLEQIEKTNSISTAAKNIDISYNKAWRVIKEAEDALGDSLIYRRVGGKNGGGSVVTPAGLEFIVKFKRFQLQTTTFTTQIFGKV